MSKVKELIKNLSPLNNRTEMPAVLYIIKVVLLFFFCKLSGELIGEGVVMLIHFACGKNPLQGEMFDPITITLMMYFGYSIMIFITMLIWKLFQKKTLSELGVTGKIGHYLIGLAVGTVLVVASVFAVVLTGTIKYIGIFQYSNIPLVVLFFFACSSVNISFSEAFISFTTFSFIVFDHLHFSIESSLRRDCFLLTKRWRFTGTYS